MINVFPQVAAISAIFTLVIKVNLYDTLLGVYFVFIGSSAYYMMLLKNYMDSLPRELDESAPSTAPIPSRSSTWWFCR